VRAAQRIFSISSPGERLPNSPCRVWLKAAIIPSLALQKSHFMPDDRILTAFSPFFYSLQQHPCSSSFLFKWSGQCRIHIMRDRVAVPDYLSELRLPLHLAQVLVGTPPTPSKLECVAFRARRTSYAPCLPPLMGEEVSFSRKNRHQDAITTMHS
jgi:hypothetical protein